MFLTAALAVLVTMALALVRAFKGPTVYDRILALNMIGTQTVLLISVLLINLLSVYLIRKMRSARLVVT